MFADRRYAIIVAAIIVAGATLRIWNLDGSPYGIFQDEASTAVDAHALWHTGHDTAGAFLPLISKAMGTYPTTLLRYLDAPLVGLFGMSPATTRLAAALAGIVMMLALYVAAKYAFDDRVALGALASAAICPTWIHYSRLGMEFILLPTFLTLAFAFIEYAKAKNEPRWYLAAAAAAGISAHSYMTVRLFLPLWLAGLLVYAKPELQKLWREHRRILFGALAIGTVLTLPAAFIAVSPEGMQRTKWVTIWYRETDPFKVILHGLRAYSSFFQPSLLFVGWGGDAHRAAGMGIWSWIDLLAIAGLARAIINIVKKQNARPYAFLIYWFLIGPIPASLTNDYPNVGRAIQWLPAPMILTGIGVREVLALADRMKDRMRSIAKIAIPIGLAAAFLWCGFRSARSELISYPAAIGRGFQADILELMRAARATAESMDPKPRIVVSDELYVPDVFARFFFEDRLPWSVGKRTKVEPGELYVFPASGAKPRGKLIAEARVRNEQSACGFVFGSE